MIVIPISIGLILGSAGVIWAGKKLVQWWTNRKEES